MRAALLYGPGELRIEDLPQPEPGPGEVVLRVTSALTCGTDVKMFRRGHPSAKKYPVRLGHEFAGEIGAVGEGVEGFHLGGRVFCANSAPCGTCFYCRQERFSLCEDLLYLLGGFAEMVLVPARIVSKNLHHLPPGLDPDLAPMAEPLACCIHAVGRSQVQPRESVAVLGGGSLGLMLCALVARLGARPIVLDPHEERLALASKFGAAEAVVAERGPADVQAVRDLTGGRGADQVIEAVGRSQAWELAISMARPGGIVNLFGGCPIGSWVRVATEVVHYQEVTLQGTYHHTPRHIAEALVILAADDFPWHELCGPTIALADLEGALNGRLGEQAGRKHRVVVER